VYYDLMDDIVKALNDKGIEIPFNQLDVNLKSIPEKAESAKADVQESKVVPEAKKATRTRTRKKSE